MSVVRIDVNELAAEITRKIRDEISALKIVSYGEVKTVAQLSNGGWTATVLMPGAASESLPFNCLSHYVPSVGDWVMIMHPPGGDSIIIGEAPAAENTIQTPPDLFSSIYHNHDAVYTPLDRSNLLPDHKTWASPMEWIDYDNLGMAVLAHKIVSTENIIEVSPVIEIDPNKHYELLLSIHGDPLDAATGTRYFGIYTYDQNMSTIPIIAASGAESSNHYFWNGDLGNEWRHMRAFIYPHDTPLDKLKGGLNVANAIKFRSDTKYLAMRYLNYYNSGIEITNWFYGPIIREVDPSEIRL